MNLQKKYINGTEKTVRISSSNSSIFRMVRAVKRKVTSITRAARRHIVYNFSS